MVTAGPFQGGGFNVIEEGFVLIRSGGTETNEDGARQVAGWLDGEGGEVKSACIIPERAR